MGLRKAASYSKKIVVPYTRKSKVKSKAYIKAVPNADIAKYSMGNEVALNVGKLPCQLTLVTTENIVAKARIPGLSYCLENIQPTKMINIKKKVIKNHVFLILEAALEYKVGIVVSYSFTRIIKIVLLELLFGQLPLFQTNPSS